MFLAQSPTEPFLHHIILKPAKTMMKLDLCDGRDRCCPGEHHACAGMYVRQDGVVNISVHICVHARYRICICAHVCLACFDWCCLYYFVRNSLVAFLEALCARIFSWDLWTSVFFWHFFSVFWFGVCARSLTKPFFQPSQPGSCAWLSPFLLCADCTYVLVCVCLCMCMWKCKGKLINI